MLNTLFRNHTTDVTWLAIIGIVAFAATYILRYFIRTQRAEHPELVIILIKTREALITLIAVALIRIGMLGFETSNEAWSRSIAHALSIAFIATVVWFICEVLIAAEGILLSKYSLDHAGDDIRTRKAHTQIILLRRLLVAFVITVGIAAALMTFPAVRVMGQGVLASAGLISIVAGLAAQTTLSNVIAGIQLTITDSLRVGDIIEVENESGTVGEITLTYVVVYLWDDRRLILPSSYFISNPFENWTRWGDRITGVVLLEVDWTVPLADLRAELQRTLDASPLWDKRSFAMTVAGAANGNVTLRIAVSAASTNDMFGLNALVRETVVTFLASLGGPGLPRLRSEDTSDSPHAESGRANLAHRPIHT